MGTRIVDPNKIDKTPPPAPRQLPLQEQWVPDHPAPGQTAEEWMQDPRNPQRHNYHIRGRKWPGRLPGEG